MRFALAVFLLLAAPAFAQQAQQQPPEIQGLLGMLHDSTQREAVATVEVIKLRQQIDGLKTQLAAITKDRDDLKAKPNPQ